jgi:hypothetical protein
MRASTSRIIYCIGLFSLTACAVLPVPTVAPVAAVTSVAPMKVEVRLAQSIRERIELEASLPAEHPGVVHALATEDALRQLAFADDGDASRTELIAALADELSAALASRSSVAADAKQHDHVETVISGLVGAINSEVHRNRV